MQTQLWTEKYRPVALAEILAQQSVIEIVKRFAEHGSLPHLLFHGPPGTGKTSTILALANQLFGANFASMVLELNASDARGIDVVRDEIQSFSSTARPDRGQFKLVIMDESDSMTKDAQFALRRVMEKYTRHTRFCLIGNYASKIIPAIQSRCTKFRFSPLSQALVRERLRHIVARESISATESSLEAVQRLGGGDMRKTLNILQSSSLASKGCITDDVVYSTTGHVHREDIKSLVSCLLNQPVDRVFESLQKIKHNRNFALVDVVNLLQDCVFSLHLTPAVRAGLILGLADLEYSLSFAGTEKIQTLTLISVFAVARDMSST